MENDKIEKLLNKIGNEQIPLEAEEIAQSEFAKFSENLKENEHIKFKEYFMKKNIIRLSIAAAVIIIVLSGIPFFKSSGPKVTLAAVYQKMQLVDAFMYKTRMNTTTNVQPGMPAVLFFRPEYVQLSENRDGKGNGTNSGSALVERVTFLGSSVDVVVRCGEIALRVRAHPTDAPFAGKSVHFSVEQSSCIVFPAAGHREQV